MYLVNKTAIPDKILQSVITQASKAVGIENIDRLVVFANPTRRKKYGRLPACRGYVTESMYAWLRPNKGVITNGSVCHLTIPTPQRFWFFVATQLPYGNVDEGYVSNSPSDWATDIFSLIVHELSHVRDILDKRNKSLPMSKPSFEGGRRPRHNHRPEEIRAIMCVIDALHKHAHRHASVRRLQGWGQGRWVREDA